MSIWRYNFQISEEYSNPRHFNLQKTVKNKGKLDDISLRLETSPRKSLRRLAQQNGVSVGSAWTVSKLLHVLPYKITIVPEIKPRDYEKRVVFCNSFINILHDGLIDPKLTFSQMRLILIFHNMVTHKTTGTGVVKILMLYFSFRFTTKK
jgi:hypothetical protein